MRSLLVGSLLFATACASTAPPVADVPQDVAAVRSGMDAWVAHMESGATDSLAALVTPDFSFIREGKRSTLADVVALIKAYQITELKIRLQNVSVHTSGDLGYLLYDDDESFKTAGTAATATETGLIMFRRGTNGWRIATWAVSSPPPPPVK